MRAASCALRAGMDHFQESEFYSESLAPIRVARLPEDIYGHERLQRWVSHAVRDCAQGMQEPPSLLDPARTAIVVLAPDATRTQADNGFYAALVAAALQQLHTGAAPTPCADAHIVKVIAQGRAGLGSGLQHAMSMLSEQVAEQVLLIGVDSYLNAADMNAMLRAERLLVKGNSNGFLPGEAAAALLLTLAAPDAQGVLMEGIGQANEAGRPDGSVPSRAIGLTQAIRAACEEAQVTPADLVFRISDQNGEQFFAREAANAMARIMFGTKQLAHLTLADKIGEVGAATGAAMLAWLSHDMPRKNHSPGKLGVLHLANDGGERCAVVVRHIGES
jgi:3-oxoacyl-[acyl-carrier-protein] synthase-1